nr:DUF559 domain-containing protein [Propionibacterium sp.]
MNEELVLALAQGGGLIALHRGSPLRGRVAGAVRRGELQRVLLGIYAPTGHLDCRLRCGALQLADPDAVIMGEAAAWLLGFDKAREPQRVTALSRRLRLDDSTFRTYDRRLAPELVELVDGIRVTCPALTALDLSHTQGGRPIDAALRAGIALPTLWAAFRAAPNRPGNATIRRLLLESRDEPWSEAEREAHRLLHRARIAGWHTNHPVRLPGGWVRLDIAFPRLQLALEIDGYAFHSGRAEFEADRTRDVALALAGWAVHRFTAARVFGHPDAFVAEVQALLAQRAGRSRRTA